MSPARKAAVPFPFGCEWRIVKIDETDHAEEWARENGVKSCGFFYLYDAGRRVHICSFTASQELFPMAGYVLFANERTPENEGRHGEIEDEWERSEDENPCTYVDCSDMFRWPSQPTGWAPTSQEGETEEAYYQRAIEEFREHYAGNPPWFTEGA